MSQTRRLAAILAADVAGYSRLMGTDEEGTLEHLKALRRELIDPKTVEHHGRIVKTTGDGLLMEFASVIDALRCASDVQTAMAERNADVPPEARIEFRVGIHQGDIVVDEGDIFGDGVNVAARLEGLAHPGGICVSGRVQEDTTGKLDLVFEDMGQQTLKNIARPIRIYRVGLDGMNRQSAVKPVDAAPVLRLPDKPSIAVLPFANMSGDPEREWDLAPDSRDRLNAPKAAPMPSCRGCGCFLRYCARRLETSAAVSVPCLPPKCLSTKLPSADTSASL